MLAAGLVVAVAGPAAAVPAEPVAEASEGPVVEVEHVAAAGAAAANPHRIPPSKRPSQGLTPGEPHGASPTRPPRPSK